MAEIATLRKVLRFANCIQRERLNICSLLIARNGDVCADTFDPDVMSSTSHEFRVRAYSHNQKMTDAALTNLQYEFTCEDCTSGYESILIMARVTAEDDENLEDMREEFKELGSSSVMLTPVFRSMLEKFNTLLGKVIQDHVFRWEKSSKHPEPAAEHPSSPFFEIASVVDKILGDSKDRSGQEMSFLLTRCFDSLEPLDAFTKYLDKKYICSKTKNHMIGQDFDNCANAFFTLLVGVMTLKESYHIEFLFVEQLLACEAKIDENLLSCLRPGSKPKPNPKTLTLVRFLQALHEYQQSIFSLVTKTAAYLDMLLYEEHRSIVSAMVEDGLHVNDNLLLLCKQCRSPDKKRNNVRKIMSNEELVKSSLVHIDKLHNLEIAIIEEIEYCQIISEPNIALSTSGKGNKIQRNSSICNKNLPEHGQIQNLSLDPNEKHAFSNMSSGETRKMIETMTPELMRSTLMSLLKVEPERSYSRPLTPMEKLDEFDEEPSLPLQLVPVVNEWQVDLNEVKFKKKIGSGGAGTTYLSKWRREDVAVKVAAATGLGIFGWKKEIQFLKNLHHPNVIRMLGCVYNEQPFTMCILLEFCDKGNLGSLLNMSTPKNFFLTASLGLANGLSYLHNKGIIHRDIKPDNILVHGNLDTGDFAVKIIDFGLSVMFDPNKHIDLRPTYQEEKCNPIDDETHTAEAGTYRWMAPEIIRHEKYNFKCDIYSFAIVLWQLITREKPYADKEQEEAAQLVQSEGLRPPFPKGTPLQIKNLIEKCWSDDPSERPVFDDVCEMIESVKKVLSKSDISWLNSHHGHQIYSRMRSSETGFLIGEQRKSSVSRRASGMFRMSMSLITSSREISPNGGKNLKRLNSR